MTLIGMVICLAWNAQGQDVFNPLVVAPDINPAPLGCLAENGAGTINFNFGLSTSTDAPLVSGDELTLTISLQSVEPSNLGDPVASLTGTAKNLFTWQYAASVNSYLGTQNALIPGFGGGTLIIEVTITANSDQSNPQNGFSVNVQPAGYMQGSNTSTDDNVSSFTYTRCADNCTTGITSVVACDANDPCTINDQMTVLDSDGSICIPCKGTPVDCSNGATSVMACNDQDPNTVNDKKTILSPLRKLNHKSCQILQ